MDFQRVKCLPITVIGGLFLLAGCQQDYSDYQEFSNLPETESSNSESQPQETVSTLSQVTKSPILADSATPISPLTAPRPNQGDQTDDQPLVAVKPVFGQNSEEVKSNIDNQSVSIEKREIKLLVEQPEFRKEENAWRVSYDDLDLLKVLNMEPVPTDASTHFPTWLNDLEGQRIRIRGFMYPPFREEGIDFFVLARDNQICCFGRNPKIYDLINIEMRNGVTTNYILNRPFDVIGTFHIRPEADGDELYNLYEITDAVVIDK